MKTLNLKHETRNSNIMGQSLVETLFMIPVFVITVSFILWFAQVLITKQQLVTAARYGTDLILYTKLNESEIQGEIKNYLCDRNIEGRKLNADSLPDENIRVRIRDFQLPEFSNPYDVLDPGKLSLLASASSRLYSPENDTSWVEIDYKFRFPRVLSAWSGFFGSSPFPEELTVSGRSEVLAGTGCMSSIHARHR